MADQANNWLGQDSNIDLPGYTVPDLPQTPPFQNADPFSWMGNGSVFDTGSEGQYNMPFNFGEPNDQAPFDSGTYSPPADNGGYAGDTTGVTHGN